MNNPFLRAYEFERKYGLDRLKSTLEKAEQAYSTKEPETIDFCKSALECICKSIISERGDTAHNGIQDLPKLIKYTLRILGHPNDEVRGGISSLVKGIAELRNGQTIAGHGLDETTLPPSKVEIEIFVKTFAHTVDIILTLLETQEIDISNTKMKFEAVEEALKLESINEEIDSKVTVEYSAEDGVLFIDGKELRPSKILFHFDRTSYNQHIELSKEERLQRLEEALRQIILDDVRERFDNFHPGHYGLDDIDIAFDKIDIRELTIIVSGRISTSAHLGSSSDEDSIDVEYSSGLKAEFNLESSDNFDSVTLKSLGLEIVDWIQPDPEKIRA